VADDSLVDRALAAGLVQPDQTTCGSCVLVVARIVNDPSYAGFLVNGVSPVSGASAPGTLEDRFRQQSLAMHRLTAGFEDTAGGWQIPWPRALGTPPWALAREMTNETGEKGTRYRALPILPPQRADTFRRVAALAGAGHAVPLYVGNRWSPRHVVLVLPAADLPPGTVRIYDPASGRCYPIAATDFAAAHLDVAGWNVPWSVVVPT
jgi:hypothetical protein